MTFLIRLFSAIGLYILLAKSNIYLPTEAHTLFVGGYRLLLLLSPLAVVLFRRWSPCFVLALSAVACETLVWRPDSMATFFLTLGMSCGSFLIKAKAVETVRGAGLNKLAVMLGSICAGLAIVYFPEDRAFFLHLVFGLLLLSALLSWVQVRSEPRANYTHISDFKPNEGFVEGLIWLLFGCGLGIRIFGLVVILPQYLLKELGEIPDWYGWSLSLYALLVIASQLPAIFKVRSLNFNHAVVALTLSCFVLALPHLFRAECLVGVLIWSLLLAMQEIFSPYLDRMAADRGGLLFKEVGVGIGAAFSVAAMRLTHSTLLTAGAGALTVLAAYWLYRTVLHQVRAQEK